MIYTLEVGGRAVLAFEADSELAAQTIAGDQGLRSDLMILQSAGAALWDGKAAVRVRRATSAEAVKYSEDADTDGEDEEFVVFLVPVHDEFANDGRDRTRH
jgi:hypothetical protein